MRFPRFSALSCCCHLPYGTFWWMVPIVLSLTMLCCQGQGYISSSSGCLEPWSNLKEDENWSGFRILQGFMVAGHWGTGAWMSAAWSHNRSIEKVYIRKRTTPSHRQCWSKCYLFTKPHDGGWLAVKLTGKDWRNRPTLVTLGLCLWFGGGCWIGPQHLVSSVLCREHWVTWLYTPSGPRLSLDPCAPALCIWRSGDCKSHISFPLFHQKQNTS